jgi:wobble nucleotide-excising tRNase
MYQRKVDNIKEILKSRLPEGAQDKYINLGIDWAMGKDIPSDKEEDQEKLSAENIQILSDFLKNKLN